MGEQPNSRTLSQIRRVSPKDFQQAIDDGSARITTPNTELTNGLRACKEHEEESWKKFFGKVVEVPDPPHWVSETLERAIALGVTSFTPHYLPLKRFSREDDFPGWYTKPNNFYWDQIDNNNISKNAPVLTGEWILFDTTTKMDLEDAGGRIYVDDPFKDLLPNGSRFNLSAYTLRSGTLSEIATFLGVDADQVRLPSAIEYNLLGNLHYPSTLGNVEDTSEWLSDKYSAFGFGLFGGDYSLGGLAYIELADELDKTASRGFRPVIHSPGEK